MDDEILKQYGGTKLNDLNDLLHTFQDSDDEVTTMQHSHYYEWEGLRDILISNKGHFSVLSLNIQSIRAKFDKLMSLLKYLNEKNCNFSAICIQETWLKENDDVSLLHIPGYHLIHQGTRCSAHGGLIIYLRTEFTYRHKTMYDSSSRWEGLFLDIHHDNIKSKIVIGNIYRPPRRNNCNNEIELFLEEFKPIVQKLNKEKAVVILPGDYNLNLLDIQERDKIQEYHDLLSSNGMYPKITLPTRFSRRNCTLIDQIFCKFSAVTQLSLSGILFGALSDHLACFSCIDLFDNKQKSRQKWTRVYNHTETDVHNFCRELESSISNTHFDMNLDNDPNENYNKLEHIITTAKQKHMPSKLEKVKKYKHKLSPWITTAIIRSVKFRDQLYKKMKSCCPDSQEYATIRINLNTYNSILQKTIRHAKSTYYGREFEKHKNDSRKTWCTIKNVINKNKSSKEFPSYFLINNIKETNNNIIADKFNQFFTNIGPSLAKKIKTDSPASYNSFMTQNILSSFHFSLVTGESVEKLIQSLKTKTSSGHDEISTVLLKRISSSLSGLLSLMINQSLLTGIFPDRLKIAKVLPLYKKDNPYIFDNYRPISLLPSISKVFEKVVFKQVYEYFHSNNLLYKSQYGFRADHSTEFASLELCDRIHRYLDEGKVPVTVFLDLSKAFDTLDHEILLNKLNYYGVHNVALNWFKSYLSDRQQYIEFNGTSSSILKIQTGVPQGSILGPLLFLIYMNDIHLVSDKFNSILYADDTTLDSPLCSFDIMSDNKGYNKAIITKSINSELKAITDWLAVNKLSLNVKKTKFMIFHYWQRDISTYIPEIIIDNIPIERVRDFNFLGLTIDDHMTWKAHTHKIANKISRSLGVINSLKNILPRAILLTLYNSLVLPHLQYSILCWGFNPGRVTTLQKRALRLISGSKYRAHTEPICKQLGLLKLNDIFHLSILKFYFKFKKKKLPHYLQNMFPENDPEPAYDTRNRYIHRPHSKKVSSAKCIRYHMPSAVEKSPVLVIEKADTHSRKGFTNYAKNYLLSLYSMVCTVINCRVCNS